MQTVKHAVICAAGLGSRLEVNMPKCLVEVGGQSIISHQLEMLKNVDDIRIVVGFMEEAVIETVRKIRNDVIFVRNPDYRTTSNAYSLYLATHSLKNPYLMLDGDLLFEKNSINSFLERCNVDHSIIGVSESKTEDAVFVELDNAGEHIVRFQRDNKQRYEWCGLAYLSNLPIRKEGEYVFNELEKYLPLKAHPVCCYEIDTPEDLNYAINHFKST